MKKSKSFPQLERLCRITKMLYYEISNNKRNTDENLAQLCWTIKLLYTQLFDNNSDATKFEKLCHLTHFLYNEIFDGSDKTCHLEQVYKYGKLYGFIVNILYNLHQPSQKTIEFITDTINDIHIKIIKENEITCDDITFIQNIMTTHENNIFLQKKCMNCLNKISFNTNDCKLICETPFLNEIIPIANNIIFENSIDIQIYISSIFANIARTVDGREHINNDTTKYILNIIYKENNSVELLSLCFTYLQYICLGNEFKIFFYQNHSKLLQKIKEIISQNNNYELITSTFTFFINLCFDREYEKFTEILSSMEFVESVIKFIKNSNYNKSILKISCECLLSMSESVSFYHHFIAGGGIELLVSLRNLNYEDNNLKELIFNCIQRLINELNINEILIFDINYSSLHFPAQNGDLKTIYKVLKNTNIDINQIDKNGNTSLHIAVQNNRINIVKYLVCCGIDINIKNLNNKSALNSKKFMTKNIKSYNNLYKNFKNNIISSISNNLKRNDDIPKIIFQYYDIYTHAYLNNDKFMK